MGTVSSHFEAELKKRIEAERQRLRDDLAAGLAVKDYAQYQNYVGRLQALHQVTEEFCDEVNERLDQR